MLRRSLPLSILLLLRDVEVNIFILRQAVFDTSAFFYFIVRDAVILGLLNAVSVLTLLLLYFNGSFLS